MCEICRYNPCHPSCPNADEPPVYGKCEICDLSIYDGESCYLLDGHIYCETCVSEGHTTAEVDE